MSATPFTKGQDLSSQLDVIKRRWEKEEADAQGWATASTTLLSLKSLCGGGPPLGCSSFFFFGRRRVGVAVQ